MHLANGFHPRGWVQGFIIIVDRVLLTADINRVLIGSPIVSGFSFIL